MVIGISVIEIYLGFGICDLEFLNFMILNKTLEQFGLSSAEASVYLATLELGSASVLKIAKKAEIKRPTAYLILDTLIEKGLVSRLPKENKTFYVAENPEKLINVLKEKEKGIQNIMPLLKAIYNVDKAKPQVRFYEGRDGLASIYDMILKSKTEILFYGYIKQLLKEFPESFIKVEDIKKNKLKVREIVTQDKFDLEYAHSVIKSKNPRHHIRTLTKDLIIETDNAIFENKIAIFSIKKDFFVVVIESADIANSYRAMFELAWRSAERIK